MTVRDAFKLAWQGSPAARDELCRALPGVPQGDIDRLLAALLSFNPEPTEAALVLSTPSGVAVGRGGRATFQVWKEIMEAARHSLVVMTYTVGHESRAILETAFQRQCDGVQVTLVMEDSPQNLDAFQRNWPDVADPARILVPNRTVWPAGILHGKVICADESDLFVSSANLTGRAVDHNLEVGVKLGAPHAREFMRYLRDWSEARLLVPPSP